MPVTNFALIKKVEYPLVLVAILLAVYVCYSEAIGHGIIHWDSHKYIIDNACVHGLTLSNLDCIFTKVYFSNWHPLTSLSYAIEYEFFGANPKIYHINNLLLHSINCFLIYLLSKKIFILQYLPAPRALVGAVAAAGLFAVHPQHVESVAWIAERKGLLSTLFFLLAVLFYIYFVTTDFVKMRVKFFLLAFIAFILSLLSKSMAITMPFLLILIDIYPLKRVDFSQGLASVARCIFSLFIEKSFFFLAALIMVGITIYAQGTSGAIASSEFVGLPLRCVNAIYSFFFYLGKWVSPLNLSPFYSHPDFIINGEKIPIILYIFSFIGVTGISLYYFFEGKPAVIVIFLFVVISLAPVIGVIQVGVQGAADRYTYLPLIPLYIVAGYYFSKMLFHTRLFIKTTALVSCVLLLTYFTAVSRIQVKVWHDNLSLWVYVNGNWIEGNALPNGINIFQVLWLAIAYYVEEDFENALKYYILADSIGQFPYLELYMPFAKSYARMGMDRMALQIYEFMLNENVSDRELNNLIYSEVAAIKNRIKNSE